jgi:hypothetical protein
MKERLLRLAILRRTLKNCIEQLTWTSGMAE